MVNKSFFILESILNKNPLIEITAPSISRKLIRSACGLILKSALPHCKKNFYSNVLGRNQPFYNGGYQEVMSSGYAHYRYVLLILCGSVYVLRER